VGLLPPSLQGILNSLSLGVRRMLLKQTTGLLVLVTAVSAGISSSLAIAQNQSVSSFSVSGATIQGITGEPYSAELVTTRIQTLADGTRITHVSKQIQARDSQGRTRMEVYPDESQHIPGRDANQPVFVAIFDPASGQNTYLDPRQKTAIVSLIPSLLQHLNTSASPQPNSGIGIGSSSTGGITSSISPGSAPKIRTQREKLPGQIIDGIYAEGTRITDVIPAGSEGNDREITVITENWCSPELKIEVLRKYSDPRSGDGTTEIKNLSRDEPSPELFQVPAGYKIETRQ
jgi:hypothetical protein